MRYLPAGVVVWIACTACTAPPKDNLDVVRMTLTRSITNAPLVIADEEGFFRDEGIRIEHHRAPGRAGDPIEVLGGMHARQLFARCRDWLHHSSAAIAVIGSDDIENVRTFGPLRMSRRRHVFVKASG